MNIITFNYTKSTGKTSQRTLSPTTVPNNMYEGTDLSDIDVEDQVMYCQALGKLHDEYLSKVAQLQAEFDLTKCYRRFDPSKMSEVVMEAV